jgi:hypothetical protein
MKYAVEICSGDIHTAFHKDRFRCSEVLRRIHIQTYRGTNRQHGDLITIEL